MTVNNIVLVNDLVRKTGVPNAKGLKIPVNTKLNIAFFEAICQNDKDKQTVQYMKFGWPLGHDGHTIPPEPKRNHKGARDFPEATMEYLQSEKNKHRIVGPFDNKVFTARNGISPINSVPRKDSDRCHFVLDLSFPKGKGINSGIDKDKYEGENIDLKYPTVDDLVDLVVRKKEKTGERVLLWKRDLKACYRQWSLCPGDVHLVGYKVNGKFYYDMVLAMGSSSSAQICQKITDLVSKIFQDMYEEEVKNFLDDFGSATEEQRPGLLIQNWPSYSKRWASKKERKRRVPQIQ